MGDRQYCVLFSDHPLVIPVELAAAVGLNEAIVLQQIHYWCVQNRRLRQNQRDGHYWTYNSVREWQEQFPFWCHRTLQRILAGLEKQGLIVTGQYNRAKMDRTKWYRVDMDKLAEVMDAAAADLERQAVEREMRRRRGRLMIESCRHIGATVEPTPELEERVGWQLDEATANGR